MLHLDIGMTARRRTEKKTTKKLCIHLKKNSWK